MKTNNNILDRLRSAWQRVYYSRETMTVGDQWQAEAMRRIRLIGPPGTRQGYLESFEQLVWRLAPATSLLAVGLIIVFLVSGLMQENDLLAFLNDPEELDLAQLIGFGG